MGLLVDSIQEHGWVQGQMVDPVTGARCLVGHVVAVFDRGERGGNQAMLALQNLLPPNYASITVWNDADSTSYEDAILIAKRADEILVEWGVE